jgi:acetolactate decarboxylase
MKRKAIFLLILSAFFSGCAFTQPGRPACLSGRQVVYQSAPLVRFSGGSYAGTLSFRELKTYGNFGIGTVNGLDGEMIALDNRFYQIRSDGKVYLIEDETLTPFATVTRFLPQMQKTLNVRTDYAGLAGILDSILADKEKVYAIKITGKFNALKLRSVPAQVKPFPRLEEVIKKQEVFEYKDMPGVLVGFRFPENMDGVAFAGYHFHFISQDRNAGGHLLDCRIEHVFVEIEEISQLVLNCNSSA